MRLVRKKFSHCLYNENDLCDIDVTWQPWRVDWDAHAWTMMTSLYYSLGTVDAIQWACVLCGCCIQNAWASIATNLHWVLHEAWTLLWGNYLDDSEGLGYGQLVIGSFTTTTWPTHASRLIQSFLVKHQITPYSPDLVPCNLWFFPKLKSLLKERDFRPSMRLRKI